MGPWEIIFIAIGLSMDAFAVSVAEGMIVHRVEPRHTFRVAGYFGIFQALMPILGFWLGIGLSEFVDAWDHWVAFALLVLIGGKMLLDTLTKFETHEPRAETSHRRMLALALATSIDALAVGVTLGLHDGDVLGPAIIIGAVTGIICAVGIHLGDRTGAIVGRWGELLGGTALCLIGAKILAEGMGWM